MPDELSLHFARYYYELGEYADALPLYLFVLSTVPDSVRPSVNYELARSYKELGECRQALTHFLAYLQTRRRGQLAADARWHAGQCAYRLAERDRLNGRPTDAMEKFDLVIDRVRISPRDRKRIVHSRRVRRGSSVVREGVGP